jgi:hypothetical protein
MKYLNTNGTNSVLVNRNLHTLPICQTLSNYRSKAVYYQIWGDCFGKVRLAMTLAKCKMLLTNTEWHELLMVFSCHSFHFLNSY